MAQRLYEGVEIGAEGTTGLITYMRTDSPRVAPEAIAGAREWIGKQLGAQYLPATPNVYKGKKDAQDAHEAIRPTDASRTPESIARYLTEEQLKLYRLIWQRFVASQMMPAVFDVTTAKIAAVSSKTGKTYDFRVSGSVVRFDGFLKVYEVAGRQEGRRRRRGEQQAAQPGQREEAGAREAGDASSTLRSRLRATTKLRW